MERVAIADVVTPGAGEGVAGVDLGEALGTTDVAMSQYEVDPGERGSGLHAHRDQEEVFLVVAGELTFETWTADDATEEAGPRVAVAAGEAIRFAPGEFQSCVNRADATAVVLALGAPPGSESVLVPVPCPDCEGRAMAPRLAGGDPVLVCPDCGAEEAPSCPSCGGGSLNVVLDEATATPVERCRDCGATRSPE